MRKILLATLAATALVPAGAGAQTAREVRHDQREVARDQAKEEAQVATGQYRRAARTARETREDVRETNQDWRAYRRTHRNVFTRPAYVWPRGYSYRPLSVGSVLDRLFWGSTYRISNYATYRLPYPGPNREWVRYGNDAVLISLRTGRVITVYTDFFY
ncbi:MAG: RcnB family protein [Porphyrobacter sp.]|nr:RcnB family protein [Porphyrobacter sp.]